MQTILDLKKAFIDSGWWDVSLDGMRFPGSLNTVTTNCAGR